MGIKNVRVLIICVGVLLSVLTPKATEFLPKKASNTTKIGIEKAIKAGPNNFQTRVRADMRPLNFYEGTNVSTSLKLKFIDLLRKLVPYTQLGSPTFWFLENNVNSRPPTIQTLNNSEEYKRVDSGRDFKDQFLLGRNPDLVSDQEVSSVGHKNYGRWNLPKAYGKMSSDPVNRSGFGYTPHTTNDKRHYPYKSISKPGSYRQQQRKYEEEFGDTNLETLNSFNKYEGNSNTGSGKYLTLNSDFGETLSAGHNHYTAKGHGYGSYGQSHYLDPFSILAGLAFLTFLALLIQQIIAGVGMGAMGRRVYGSHYKDEWIPSLLANLEEIFSNESRVHSLKSP